MAIDLKKDGISSEREGKDILSISEWCGSRKMCYITYVFLGRFKGIWGNSIAG